ncbi:MAG: hypothetical protein N2645_02480 [Clostridia bacterium]|nr:hypothetical protein [Clostridia bacterium]
MDRKSSLIGFIFIAIGLTFLFNNLHILNIHIRLFDIGYFLANFWPALFLILPGLILNSIYFSGKVRNIDVLVPGGLFLGLGLTCQISMYFNVWNIMWPGFILAPAIGLFELYLFGGRNKILLIPIFILSGTSLVFFYCFSPTFHILGFNFKSMIIPFILILAGIKILSKDAPAKSIL